MEEVYLRARYYQPAVGRFLTRDTYTGEADEPLSLHFYTYCENDGVNYIDSSGHKKSNATPATSEVKGIITREIKKMTKLKKGTKVKNVLKRTIQNREDWCTPSEKKRV